MSGPRARYVPAVIALVLTLAAGCGPFNTYYDLRRQAEIPPRATYRWENEKAAAAPVTAHIAGAVEAQLAARGYAKSAKAPPGFLVAYRLTITKVREQHAFNVGPRYDVSPDFYYRCAPVQREWLSQYDYMYIIRMKGTLAIYAIDPRTRETLWQGVADEVFDEFASPAENVRIQRAAVAELMTKFPGKIK